MVVVVIVGISVGADVLHLQDVAALRAALDRAVTGHLDKAELGYCTILIYGDLFQGAEELTVSQVVTWESAG